MSATKVVWFQLGIKTRRAKMRIAGIVVVQNRAPSQTISARSVAPARNRLRFSSPEDIA